MRYLLMMVLLIAGSTILVKSWEKIPRLKLAQSFITKTKDGELRISENALEDIIQFSIKEIKGLKRWRTEIAEDGQRLMITITCQMQEGAEIQKTGTAIQTRIRDNIQQYSGLSVKEVRVLVQPINHFSRARK